MHQGFSFDLVFELFLNNIKEWGYNISLLKKFLANGKCVASCLVAVTFLFRHINLSGSSSVQEQDETLISTQLSQLRKVCFQISAGLM